MKTGQTTSASCITAMILIMQVMPAYTVRAEDLGRLFTTPEQRIALEKSRRMQPEPDLISEIVLPEEKPVVEETPKPEIGGITLNGLVYRKNGKSTAWVNNASTLDGNLANQYLQIDANNIDPDKVVIEIPAAETNIKLKAGETYVPVTEKIQSADNL